MMLMLTALAMIVSLVSMTPTEARAAALPDGFDGDLLLMTPFRVTTKPNVLVKWGRTAVVGEPLMTYEFQVTRTPMRAIMPRQWHYYTTKRGPGSMSVSVEAGTVLCVRTRATNASGTGPWGYRDCVVRALGDEQLKRKHGVKRVRDRHYRDDKASRLKGRARLILPKVPAYSYVATITTGNSPRCTLPAYWLKGTRSKHRGGYGGAQSKKVWILGDDLTTGGRLIIGSKLQGHKKKVCRVGGIGVVPSWVFAL